MKRDPALRQSSCLVVTSLTHCSLTRLIPDFSFHEDFGLISLVILLTLNRTRKMTQQKGNASECLRQQMTRKRKYLCRAIVPSRKGVGVAQGVSPLSCPPRLAAELRATRSAGRCVDTARSRQQRPRPGTQRSSLPGLKGDGVGGSRGWESSVGSWPVPSQFTLRSTEPRHFCPLPTQATGHSPASSTRDCASVGVSWSSLSCDCCCRELWSVLPVALHLRWLSDCSTLWSDVSVKKHRAHSIAYVRCFNCTYSWSFYSHWG